MATLAKAAAELLTSGFESERMIVQTLADLREPLRLLGDRGRIDIKQRRRIFVGPELGQLQVVVIGKQPI